MTRLLNFIFVTYLTLSKHSERSNSPAVNYIYYIFPVVLTKNLSRRFYKTGSLLIIHDIQLSVSFSFLVSWLELPPNVPQLQCLSTGPLCSGIPRCRYRRNRYLRSTEFPDHALLQQVSYSQWLPLWTGESHISTILFSLSMAANGVFPFVLSTTIRHGASSITLTVFSASGMANAHSGIRA